MKRPLVWILLFFIAGILMGRYFQNDIALFFAVSVAGTVALYYKFRKNLVILLPVAVLLGFFIITARASGQYPEIDRLIEANDAVTIRAVVLDAGKTQTGNSKALVSTESFVAETGGQLHERVSVMVYFNGDIPASVGDKMTLTGVLSPPDFLRNPGGYDEQQYFRSRKIDYKLFADTAQKDGAATGLHLIFPMIREKLSAVFDQALPEKGAGIMKAMIIGDKSGVDEEIAALFRAAGIYHILAVSGLHVSIMAMLIGGALSRVFKKRTADGILILFLLFYCVLTGAGIATTRAVIMCIVGICGRLFHKEGDSVVTASFAALCLLIYEPFYLWDIGFQYSFIAVYGLMIGTGAFERLFVNIKGALPFTRYFFDVPWISKYLAGTLAATAATAPVMMYHFYYFLPVSVITNLLIVPTVVVLLIGGLVIGVSGLFGMALASFVGLICRFFLDIYEFICVHTLTIPLANILTGANSIPVLAALYAVLGLFWYMLYAGAAEIKQRTRYFYAGCLLLCSLAAIAFIYPRRLSVDMLDVGQGDSFVISKGSATFMIDGGGNMLKGVGDNTGENVILPYLESKGIAAIDAAFVTHTDADHAIGVIETMTQKHIRRLFLPESARAGGEDSEYLDLLIATATDNDTEIQYLSAGDEVTFNNDIRVQCLFPEKSTQLSGNEGSLVLKVTYGASAFLFTGDIGFESEKLLLRDGADSIGADVLKIAHHGSKYASGGVFIGAVSPKIALISAGRNNRYGHPSPEVLENLSDRGIPAYDTPQHGAVLLQTDGKTITVKTMAEESR